jgi:hypothetical protein
VKATLVRVAICNEVAESRFSRHHQYFSVGNVALSAVCPDRNLSLLAQCRRITEDWYLKLGSVSPGIECAFGVV